MTDEQEKSEGILVTHEAFELVFDHMGEHCRALAMLIREMQELHLRLRKLELESGIETGGTDDGNSRKH